jgi:hypothetical protein
VVVKAAAAVLDGQPWFPVARDQINMLLECNTGDSMEVFEKLGIIPRRFDETALTYLNESKTQKRQVAAQERRHLAGSVRSLQIQRPLMSDRPSGYGSVYVLQRR